MVAKIMKPAAHTAQAMKTLEARIERATEDEQITRAERQSIRAQLDRVENRAQTMVAHQGKPALDAVNDVRRMLNRNTLARHADDALGELAQGRHKMWREAKHDKETNPFKHIPNAHKPFAGVATKDFNWEGHRVHLVAVDLANPNIRVQTTNPGERGKQLDDMVRSHNAEIGINGDFFSVGKNYAPSGAAMSNGKKWGGEAWEPGLVFRGQHAQMKGYNTSIPAWARNAVSARPTVLRDGKVVTDYPEHDKSLPSRRTGVGVSKSGRVMYLVAVEGGLSAKELGRLMKKVGADDAMAMDAGGSAQMYQKGRGYVQRSSDPGGERRIANAILINRLRA